MTPTLFSSKRNSSANQTAGNRDASRLKAANKDASPSKQPDEVDTRQQLNWLEDDAVRREKQEKQRQRTKSNVGSLGVSFVYVVLIVGLCSQIFVLLLFGKISDLFLRRSLEHANNFMMRNISSKRCFLNIHDDDGAIGRVPTFHTSSEQVEVSFGMYH